MGINLLFATPFHRVKPVGAEKMNAELDELILLLESSSDRKKNSPQPMHDEVFESEFDFLGRSEPVVKEFKEVVYSHLAGFVKSANRIDEDDLSKLKFNNHCWFHVTRKGGYFQPHNHPNASWSLVYYVNPGDDDLPESKEAGHIVFDDPRPQASSFMDISNDNMSREMTFNPVRLRPNKGEMIIFPSYLKHWVEPYMGDSPRITIAANFWFYK